MKEHATFQRKKIYDPIQRILHWLIALSISILLVTGFTSEYFEKGALEKAVWMFHIFAGYVLGVSFLIRIIWGFVGPKHARFSSFFLGEKWGHDRQAALAYVGLYSAIAIMVVTGLGLAAIEHSTGPLVDWLFDAVRLEDYFEGPHEAFAWVFLAFILVHIGALIFHEKKDGVPIAQSMISGYQYRKGGESDEKMEG